MIDSTDKNDKLKGYLKKLMRIDHQNTRAEIARRLIALVPDDKQHRTEIIQSIDSLLLIVGEQTSTKVLKQILIWIT
jgi:predicted DNA-binding protein YlxM (UPF0122 family)